LTRGILECEPEVREGREDPKKERVDGLRRSVAKRELAVGAARGRDMWRNVVLGGGKPWLILGWMNE
jgi:hypothetical protein